MAELFGPALLATVPFETVGRLSVGGGDSDQSDERGKAVGDMARAELARRIPGLPDLELAMLRAHTAGPVAGPARAELLRRHPQLTPMTNESIKAAVEALCEEGGGMDDIVTPLGEGDETSADFRQSPKAEAKYGGPVGLWGVSEVTNLSDLFSFCVNFNEDVSAWDVGRAENLSFMFFEASSFNQSLVAWAVRPGVDTEDMFWRRNDANAFDQAAHAPWCYDDY